MTRLSEADVRHLGRTLGAPLCARHSTGHGRHLAAALDEDPAWADEVAAAVSEAVGPAADTHSYTTWLRGRVLYWPHVGVGDPAHADRLVLAPDDVEALRRELGPYAPVAGAARGADGGFAVLSLEPASPATVARTAAYLLSEHPLWVEASMEVVGTPGGAAWPRVVLDPRPPEIGPAPPPRAYTDVHWGFLT